MISIFTVYSDICKKSAPAHWQIRRFKDIITSSRSGIWGDEEKGDALISEANDNGFRLF